MRHPIEDKKLSKMTILENEITGLFEWSERLNFGIARKLANFWKPFTDFPDYHFLELSLLAYDS